MNQNNVDLISFKGSLLKNQTMTEIKTIIKDKLTGLDMMKIKTDLLELTKQVLRYIKELCVQKTLTLTNDEITNFVIEIISSFVNLTLPEIELVKSGVSFLLNNKLIKRSSLYKRTKRVIINTFKKV